VAGVCLPVSNYDIRVGPISLYNGGGLI